MLLLTKSKFGKNLTSYCQTQKTTNTVEISGMLCQEEEANQT